MHKKLTNFIKNVKIVEFHDHILNHHEKCIQQKSTNMPSIDSLIREIDGGKVRYLRGKKQLLLSKTKASVLSVKYQIGLPYLL